MSRGGVAAARVQMAGGREAGGGRGGVGGGGSLAAIARPFPVPPVRSKPSPPPSAARARAVRSNAQTKKILAKEQDKKMRRTAHTKKKHEKNGGVGAIRC